jgi:hypothetical protein
MNLDVTHWLVILMIMKMCSHYLYRGPDIVVSAERVLSKCDNSIIITWIEIRFMLIVMLSNVRYTKLIISTKLLSVLRYHIDAAEI